MKGEGSKVPRESGCVRQSLLDGENAAHVCNDYRQPMNTFCVYSPDGNLGSEEFEAFGAGGFCRIWSQKLAVP